MTERITWRRVEVLHRAIEDVDPKKLMQCGVSAIVVDGDESNDETLIDLSVAPTSRRFSVTWAPDAVARAHKQFDIAYQGFDADRVEGDLHVGEFFSKDSLAIAIDALRPIVEAQDEESDCG